MKRQRRHRNINNHDGNDFYLQDFYRSSDNDNNQEYNHRQREPYKTFKSTIEAQVQNGETLQSLALKFHCTVAEIKRLNKIDKDNEIYARKTIKVPLTSHSILLGTMPDVHKSGQSSPKHNDINNEQPKTEIPSTSIINSNDLFNNTKNLSEKLIIAAVNSTEIKRPVTQIGSASLAKNNHNNLPTSSINDIILNSNYSVAFNDDESNEYYADESYNSSNEGTELLLSGYLNESYPHPIPIPNNGILDCSGSDCDISWIFLLICALAVCFAIPLIYIFYIAEHPEKFHLNST